MLRGRREHILYLVCEPRHTRSTTGQLPICHLLPTTATHLTGAASHQQPVTWHGGMRCESRHTSLLSPLSSLTQRQRERERGGGEYRVSGYEGSKESSSHHHKLHPLLTNTSCVTKRRRAATTAKHHATAAQTKTRSKQAEAAI